MRENLHDIVKTLNALSGAEVLDYLNLSKLRVTFSTSLGQEDQVIHSMSESLFPELDVFTLDTGKLFPQSYELLAKNQRRFKIPTRVVYPNKEAVENLVSRDGINGFYKSLEQRKACCNVRKIQPLSHELKKFDVWITGLRAGQSENRKDLALASWDDHFNILKVNPLLRWTYDQVIDYLNTYKVPYNPLHDQGFVSIGCQPCTRAIGPDEDIRAGRWWWETSKKECGLHQHKAS